LPNASCILAGQLVLALGLHIFPGLISGLLVPLVDSVLGLVLLEFVRPVESVLELLLLGLGLLLLKIFIRIKH
jgi:hypothetical protein